MKILSKKNILIVDSGHYFYDCVLPTILSVKKKFNVHLFLIDYNTDLFTKKLVQKLKQRKIIKHFEFIKNDNDLTSLFLQIKNLKKLKSLYQNQKIDYASFGNFNIGPSKFIINKILDKNCKKIYIQNREMYFFVRENRKLNKQTYDKLFLIKSIFFKLKVIKSFIFEFFKKRIFELFLGVMLKEDKIEKMTKILSEKTDILFVNDVVEHKNLKSRYKNKMHLINSPSHKCRCLKNKKKFKHTLLLSESSYLFKDSVPKKFLYQYSDDVDFICKKFNLSGIHHKLHPRFTGKWHLHFKQILENKGYMYHVLNNESYLSKIICNYDVFASGLSGTLRIVRNTCKNIRIIALKSASYPAHGVVNYEHLADYNGVEWLEKKNEFNMENSIYKKKESLLNLNDYLK